MREGLSRQQTLDGVELVARIHTRENELAVRISVRRIDLLDLLNLRLIQALIRPLLTVFAEKLSRVEMTLVGNFDDSILDPVDLVTLLEDLVVDQPCPGADGDIVLRVCVSGNGEEVGTVAVHVEEIDGRGTGDDAIIVLWVLVDRADAHAPAERAANVVRVLVLLVVEFFDELLAVLRASVKTGSA